MILLYCRLFAAPKCSLIISADIFRRKKIVVVKQIKRRCSENVIQKLLHR